MLLQIPPMGPHALYLYGWSRESQGLLLQEGERAAGGRGKEGGGGARLVLPGRAALK